MKRFSWLRGAMACFLTAGASAALVLACSADPGSPQPQGDTCTAPNLSCGAQCTDPQSDPNNCGACGVKCDGSKAEVCSQGKCGLACGGGTSKCGGSCFDLQSDAKNCGSCGNACAQGESCSAGKCGVGCGAGLSLCGGGADAGAPRCTDLSSDVQNCGSCGTACGVNATCQAGACKATLGTTAAVDITGGLANCTLGSPNGGKKAVISDRNELFAEIVCGGEAFIVSSTNGGLTYSAPMSTGLKGVGETAIAIQAGPKPVLYAVASVNTTIALTMSTDRGKTWTLPAAIDNNSSTYAVSIATFKDTVYVLSNPGAGGKVLRLQRNGNGAGDAGVADAGPTGFGLTVVDMGVSVYPSDLMLDPKNGDVWVGADNPNLYLAKSINGGASFTAATQAPGSTSYTDWALGNGTIFVAGMGDSLYAIPTSAPTTSVAYTGLGASIARSIAVDSAGTAFVATPVSGAVNLHRVSLPIQGTVLPAPRVIAASGVPSQAVVASGPIDTTFVVYNVGGKLFATVQKL